MKLTSTAVKNSEYLNKKKIENVLQISQQYSTKETMTASNPVPPTTISSCTQEKKNLYTHFTKNIT